MAIDGLGCIYLLENSEDGPDGHQAVDVGRPVEWVEAHHVFTTLITFDLGKYTNTLLLELYEFFSSGSPYAVHLIGVHAVKWVCQTKRRVPIKALISITGITPNRVKF